MESTRNKNEKCRKFLILSIFSVVFIYLLGCSSTPPQVNTPENAREDSIPVTLDVSEELKMEIFHTSVIRYFRRYNPTLQNNTTFLVQYGVYAVTVSYVDNKIIIRSTTPDKHSLWLSNISNLMRQNAASR